MMMVAGATRGPRPRHIANISCFIFVRHPRLHHHHHHHHHCCCSSRGPVMGAALCARSGASKVADNTAVQSKQIDADHRKEMIHQKKLKKLLLLGAGESGKSTLYRQMKRIYGNGFTSEEIDDFRIIIRGNTILFMQMLLEASDKFAGSYSPAISDASRALSARIRSIAPNSDALVMEVAHDIEQLWKADKGLVAVYDMRSKYQLPDSASYFFDKAVAIAAHDYIPSDQDILMSRVRTTGILETFFHISGTAFEIFDVGGQRNERKKWIHCFDSVTAVIFVVALSEYDQVLFEDESTNRMIEALDLFEETANSEWFGSTDTVLFLNKRDLLEEKIDKVAISDYFTEYEGGNNVDDAIAFFTRLFNARNHNAKRVIYSHTVNATDRDNVVRVFNAVRDIVLRKGMASSGLM